MSKCKTLHLRFVYILIKSRFFSSIGAYRNSVVRLRFMKSYSSAYE